MCVCFNLFLLLLLNFHISLCKDVPDNPNNITLEVTSTTKGGKTYFKCKSLETYTLLEGNDAEVVVNHKNTINYARCYFAGNDGIIYTGEFIHRNGTQSRLKITNIQAGEWNCTFLTLRDVDNMEPTVITNSTRYVQVQCRFKLHVRLLKGPSMTINKVPVEPKRQDLSTTEYDYVGYYYFQPNQPVSIQCFRILDASGSIALTMKSASNGGIMAQVNHEYKDRNLYMILTEEHDNVYLDCSYSTLHNDLLLRVYMHVNDIKIDEKDSLIIKVNGDRLQPNPIPDTTNGVTVNYLFYDITYSNNRELIITCDKDVNTQGYLTLTSYNINEDVKTYGHDDMIDSASKKSFRTEQINNSEIRCCLHRNQEKPICYVVKSTKMWPTNGLVLRGLHSKNILLDYEESVTVHLIRYKFSDNDTLNLNCYCNAPESEIYWTVNDSENQPINSNEAEFELDHSYNNTVIKCQNKNKEIQSKIILTLFYQKQPVTIPPTIETTTELAIAAGHIKQGVSKQWYIIGGIGTCIAIVLLGLLIFCLRRNKVKNSPQTQPQGIDYETLQSQKESTSHFNICNTYSPALDEINNTQYSVPYKPDLKDLYAQPIPKSQRTNQMASSDIYAEIDTNKHNNANGNGVTYAELSLAKPKDIYAEVIPKSQRNTACKEPENNYAEFYAEAIPQSQSHYGNISGNQRYVNSDSRDDYAEPAYCELLVKRTMK